MNNHINELILSKLKAVQSFVNTKQINNSNNLLLLNKLLGTTIILGLVNTKQIDSYNL